VHHFDDRAEADGTRTKEPQLMRGEQQERRPNALAAAFAQVLGDLSDGADAGGGVAAEFLLYRDKVLPQQLKDLPRRGYGECAQSAPILKHRQ
jgi:hypothetical protein